MTILKGWKTVIFNVVAMAPVAVDVFIQVASSPEFGNIVPPTWYPWYALGLTTVNIVLRSVTTTPLGRRE